MAVDSGGRNDMRQRRALQKLGADAIGSLALIEGDGVSFVGDQISVALAANSGLAFSAGDLTLNLRDTDPGLELAASGLGVLLAASNPGLTVTGGLAVVIASGQPFGLTGGLSLTLAADGGLQTDAAALEIKLATSSGLDLTASGLAIDPGSELEITAGNEINHAFPPGRFTEIDPGSDTYVLEQVSAGDLILVDSAVSAAQSVRLPDPSTCAGEHITIKNIGPDAVSFLIVAQYFNDYTGLIEGIPANGSGTSFVTVTIPRGSYTVTSDGSDWYFTSAYLAYQDVQWQRYEITYDDIGNKSGATGDITLFTLSVDILNNVIFERCFIHVRQGWFTANSGTLNVDIVVDDSNSATTRTLLSSFQLWTLTVGSFTGRSPISTPDIVATGDVEVRAEFTVSGGSTDIDDVALGRATVWIQWGNIGPAFQ